eukprot:3746_1
MLLQCLLIISLVSFIGCLFCYILSILITIINNEFTNTDFDTLNRVWLIYVPFCAACISSTFSALTCYSAANQLHQHLQTNNLYSLFVLLFPSNTLSVKVKYRLTITRCVFFMALWDLSINLWIIITWIFPIFGILYGDFPCTILGVACQICFVSSICWYLIITLLLIALLYFKVTPETLHNIQLLGHIFCFLIALVATFSIAFLTEFAAFGYVIDSNYKIECWIKNEYRQYWNIFYTLVVFSMSISVLLLIVAVYTICNSNEEQQPNYKLINKLLAFVLVFVTTWIFPFTDRISNNPSYWLTIAHHFGITIYGFGNGFVWFVLQWYYYRNNESNDLAETLTVSQHNGEQQSVDLVNVVHMTDTEDVNEKFSESISNNSSHHSGYSHLEHEMQLQRL